jgi:tRNA modification GTPase
VEKLGIARAWTAIEKADLVLLLVDATRGETAEDQTILERLPPQLPSLHVMNKIDLLGRAPAVEAAEGKTVIWLSAKTGAGIDLLREALLKAVGWHSAGEGLYMARERHLQALNLARECLQRGAERGRQPELFAEELRLAQEVLASITGEFTADDLLGEIFSRFCIGK